MQRRQFLALSLAGLATSAGVVPAAWAQAIGRGQPLPSLTFPDQHGNTHAFPGQQTRLVLFAVQKAPSDWVNTGLTELGPDQIKARGIVFLADISGMPSFVTRSFALPKMRKRPYPILLAQQAGEAGFMPQETGAVTILHVQNGHVTQINFAHDEAAVKAALAKAA